MSIRSNAAHRRWGGLFGWIALPGTVKPLNLLATALIAGLLGFVAASWLAYFGQSTPPGDVYSGGPPPAMCAGTCGDGICNGVACGETPCTCPVDCGACPAPPPTEPPSTGCDFDGVCEADRAEHRVNCPSDCPAFCGDQICEASEVNSCCGDGTDCTVAITCGDGLCSACENSSNCSRDCVGPIVTTRAPGQPPPPRQQPTDEPTETEEPTETDTPTVTPSNTPSNTPSFTPTFTDTPSPTDEATDEPRSTPTAEPTEEPEEQGPPPFLIPLLAVLGAGGLGFLLFFFTRRRKEDEDEPGAHDTE